MVGVVVDVESDELEAVELEVEDVVVVAVVDGAVGLVLEREPEHNQVWILNEWRNNMYTHFEQDTKSAAMADFVSLV